ncbi:MAG: class II fructose-bisphosphate aldolase [Anaerolineaceae bacterium]|nr:class II fructose-bisphosphate aldolase [Anaerolineaceae bacterium]
MSGTTMQDVMKEYEDSLALEQGNIRILNTDLLRKQIHRLAEISALETGPKQGWARYLTRVIALKLGIYPASIQDLYMARGRGDVPPVFTVPAINLRVLSFDAARAVFHAALGMDAAAMIFEIARSEMNYTDQRPAEYATSVLAAAIAEGYTGPVFIQGDHFQVSAKRYGADPETELEALRTLMREAVAAGFFNIDVDTSTLVDLSQESIPAQQRLNTELSALFTYFIRSIQPKGVTISVGGEIGEVGGRNSTEAELRGYLDGYQAEVNDQSAGVVGLSKISIQTGTSHGGVVLPDGSIAEVSVDFETLKQLSRVARKDFGLGGAVQHGASTLPESAFHKFVEAEACEVHLATNFMNMFYDHIPGELKSEIYRFLDEKEAKERKPGMTDEQFYYKMRKNAVGPFKKQCWTLPAEKRDDIRNAWEEQFTKLFRLLGLSGTRQYVTKYVQPVMVQPETHFYLGETAAAEEIRDLAD